MLRKFSVLLLGLLCSPISVASPINQLALSITSPDHPRTWFLGGNYDLYSQTLRWSKEKQSLYLDVVYTLNGEWPESRDPDTYKTFTLRFPGVRENEVSLELYYPDGSGRNVSLGWVRSDLFGHHVELHKNAEVSAHRKNGVLEAILLVESATGP